MIDSEQYTLSVCCVVLCPGTADSCCSWPGQASASQPVIAFVYLTSYKTCRSFVDLSEFLEIPSLLPAGCVKACQETRQHTFCSALVVTSSTLPRLLPCCLRCDSMNHGWPSFTCARRFYCKRCTDTSSPFMACNMVSFGRLGTGPLLTGQCAGAVQLIGNVVQVQRHSHHGCCQAQAQRCGGLPEEEWGGAPS